MAGTSIVTTVPSGKVQTSRLPSVIFSDMTLVVREVAGSDIQRLHALDFAPYSIKLVCAEMPIAIVVLQLHNRVKFSKQNTQAHLPAKCSTKFLAPHFKIED